MRLLDHRGIDDPPNVVALLLFLASLFAFVLIRSYVVGVDRRLDGLEARGETVLFVDRTPKPVAVKPGALPPPEDLGLWKGERR